MDWPGSAAPHFRVCVPAAKSSAACRKVLSNRDLSSEGTLPTVSGTWQRGKVLAHRGIVSLHRFISFHAFHFIAFHCMHFIAIEVCAKRATMQRITGSAWWLSGGVAAVGHVWPGLAVVRIISECTPTWQALARARPNPFCLKVLERPTVPANTPRQLGRDANHNDSTGLIGKLLLSLV